MARLFDFFLLCALKPRIFLASFLVLLALAFCGGHALAANKVATLVPPNSYTDGGWQVNIYGNAGPGATSTRWCATTSFCARDGATGALDCVSDEACTTTPSSDITTFVNARLAAARTAKGY